MERIRREYYDEDRIKPIYVHHSWEKIKDKLKNESQNNIRDFLKQQRVYTLYKKAPIKIRERNYYKVYGINEVWQLDLISMIDLAKDNDGYKYILTAIDTFSKKAYTEPVKAKSANEIVKAFEKILKRNYRQIEIVRHDRGKEFLNWPFQNFLKKHKIKQQYCFTSLPTKCAIIESFNRTLRFYIQRFFSVQEMIRNNHSKRYIDVLQSLMETYNSTIHSTTKYRPNDVNETNATRVYHNMYRKKKLETKRIINNASGQKPKIIVGNFVRAIKKRNIFDKMKPNWTEEIFRVRRVVFKRPYHMYELETLNGEQVKGLLYESEIQKIILPADTPIRMLKVNSNIFNRNALPTVEMTNGRKEDVDIKHIIKEKERSENNYYDAVKSIKK